MRYWLLVTLCLAAVIAYIQRLGLNTAEEKIRESLGFSTGEMGGVMAAWSVGYAVMQLPSGWLADLWGSRRALTLFAILWSLLTGLAAISWSHVSLMGLWFCMGMAQAGIFPCSTKSIGQWFPETQRAFASGMLASAMALGIAAAPALTGRLLTIIDWQTLLAVYTVPGLLWAIVFFTFLPESPPNARPALARQPLPARTMFSSVPLWFLCAQQFFRAAAMSFFMTWFPTFLRVTRGVDLTTSGNMAGIAGIGAMLGGLCGGICSDWLLRKTGNRRLSRQGIAVAGMSLCAGLITLAYFVADPNIAIALTSLGAFVATFGGVSGYTVAIELGGRNVATVFSLMNMFGNFGAAIFPLLAGQIVAEATRRDSVETGWAIVLFICAGIFVIDAVCWALLNPKKNLDEEPL